MKKLKDDLKELKKQKAILSGEIAEAREKGDLKENAEYHAAKERLGDVMSRIGKITDALATSRLTDEIEIKKDTVQIGVKITLEDQDDVQNVYSNMDVAYGPSYGTSN